ncbi:MAG: 50S ribosomal protein L20 [bacterium]
MPRVKRGPRGASRRNKILKAAKGYYSAKSRLLKTAKEQVWKSGLYAYRDRRARKGDFRRLWIRRINAAARLNGLSYSRFMAGLAVAGVEMDRKVLADLAVREPGAFAELARRAHAALGVEASLAA